MTNPSFSDHRPNDQPAPARQQRRPATGKRGATQGQPDNGRTWGNIVDWWTKQPHRMRYAAAGGPPEEARVSHSASKRSIAQRRGRSGRCLQWRGWTTRPLPYPPTMRPSGFIKPCLPSKVSRVPSGSLWVHEIKHDGYRLMVRRDGSCVRCSST